MKRLLNLFRAAGLGWGLLLLTLARPAPGAEPFFFIQLTDPQFGMFTENTNFTQETVNFEFAASTVNRLKPAFVIITGDLVHKPGDSEQIAEYLPKACESFLQRASHDRMLRVTSSEASCCTKWPAPGIVTNVRSPST